VSIFFRKMSNYFLSALHLMAKFKGSVGVAATGGAMYVAYENSKFTAVSRMIKVFENGVPEQTLEDKEATVSRPALHAELKEFLRPKKTSSYGIFVGVNGSGKSTAVRQVIEKLPFPSGVVYFTVPAPAASFATELATVLRLNGPLYHSSIVPPLESEGIFKMWLVLKPILDQAARGYMKKHNRPAVLVLDATDRLATADASFLKAVQEYAKDCADKGYLRFVFVGSEGSALSQLSASSAFSRADVFQGQPLDITDEDAVQFLMDRYGKEKSQATRIVQELTGGRFALLKCLQREPRFELLRESLWGATLKHLQDLKINPKDPIFSELLTPIGLQPIAWDKATKFLPLDKVDGLLKANILTEEPSRKLTIHSRFVESFLRQARASK